MANSSLKHTRFEYKDLFLKCPICDSKRIKFAFNSNNAVIGYSGFGIYTCQECDLYFCNPQPSEQSLHEFYNTDMERISEEKILQASVQRFLIPEKRKAFISQRLDPLKKYLTSGKVLDCGCGTGVFVKVLLDAGFEVEGIDLSQKAIDIGKEKLGLSNIECKRIEEVEYTESKYDAVLATTVIEHLQDPYSFLNNVWRILKKNGFIVLEFPTSDSLSFKTLGEFWHWIMTPYHLFYYNKKSIDILLQKCNFRVEGIEMLNPGWMWAESIANSIGLLDNYFKWRDDPQFIQYTIELDKVLDKISLTLNQPSVIQVYARRVD